jgi:hypothetical protein
MATAISFPGSSPSVPNPLISDPVDWSFLAAEVSFAHDATEGRQSLAARR